jgi:hypothetical protein
MRRLWIIISFIGLGLTIFPSILILTGIVTMDQNKNLMLLGTILWFGTVAFWMNKKKKIT